MITLKDHERAFADTLQGQAFVDGARRRHETSQAHRGAAAKPWTDQMAADAVQAGAELQARCSLSQRVADNAAPADLSTAKAALETAMAMRKQELVDAHAAPAHGRC